MVRIAAGLILVALSQVATAAPRPQPAVAAHRGLIGTGQPENSIGAYRAAIAAGVEVIEVDLRRTRDGELIILHDARVDRTTSGSGAVSKMTLAQLRTLDAGGGQRIPTFREALDLARGRGVRLLLDIKSGSGVEAGQVVNVARELGMLDRVIIGLRSAREAQTYRSLAPSLPLLGLVRHQSDIGHMLAAGVGMIRLHPHWVFERRAGCLGGASPSCVVQRLQKQGLAVWVLADAVGDERQSLALFNRLAGLHLDGILTDRPLLAAKAIADQNNSAATSSKLPAM